MYCVSASKIIQLTPNTNPRTPCLCYSVKCYLCSDKLQHSHVKALCIVSWRSWKHNGAKKLLKNAYKEKHFGARIHCLCGLTWIWMFLNQPNQSGLHNNTLSPARTEKDFKLISCNKTDIEHNVYVPTIS